jgi:drug/metabolite transporter (DMT)-like permease
VKRNVLLVDVALAVALAAIVLIVAPGLAVVGIIAVLALIVCGLSFGIGTIRRRRRPANLSRRSRNALDAPTKVSSRR